MLKTKVSMRPRIINDNKRLWWEGCGKGLDIADDAGLAAEELEKSLWESEECTWAMQKTAKAAVIHQSSQGLCRRLKDKWLL